MVGRVDYLRDTAALRKSTEMMQKIPLIHAGIPILPFKEQKNESGMERLLRAR